MVDSYFRNNCFKRNTFFPYISWSIREGKKGNYQFGKTKLSTKIAILILLKLHFSAKNAISILRTQHFQPKMLFSFCQNIIFKVKSNFWSWPNVIFNSNFHSNFKMWLPQILFSSDDNCIFISVNGQYFRRPPVLASIFSPAKHIIWLPNTGIHRQLAKHYVGLDSWHICIVYIMTYFLGHDLVHNSKVSLVYDFTSWWCAQLQIFSVLSFNSLSSHQFSKMPHFL